MATLRLILPGWLDSLNDYDLDATFLPELLCLRRLLARSNKRADSEVSFRAALLQSLPSEQPLPSSSAALSYLADSGRAPEGVCFRLDPVHLKVDRDHARLVSGDNLPLEAYEAEALIDCFNQHFKDDGLKLAFFHPQRWYLCLPENPGIECRDLDQVAGRSVEPFAPTGSWARQWQSWLTEAQMLFFAHSVNEQREIRGLLTVNSLWLWGGDRLPNATLSEDPLSLFGEHDFLRGAAKHFQLPLLPEFSEESVHLALAEAEQNNLLVLDSSAYELLINGDLEGWQRQLVQLETHLLLAEKLLRAKQITALEIVPLNGQIYRLTRWDRWKFWATAPSLQSLFFPAELM